MTQLSLTDDGHIKKTIKNIPAANLSLSEYNPRSNREDENINLLAKRIGNNGFEVTRALWVYQNDTGYKVFAGGTRLEAARRAGCKTIPCVIHEGLTDDDKVRLAYEDNENDEYHAEVSKVDVWANYAALADAGWTQERIAAAVGLDGSGGRAMVGYRLNLHKLPDKIKHFVTQGLLKEGHLREIMTLQLELQFQDWLTTEAAQLELCQRAAKRKRTTAETKTDVKSMKDVISYADECYGKLPAEHQAELVELLSTSKARSKQQVFTAFSAITKQLEAEARQRESELAKQQSEAEQARIELEQERAKQEAIDEILGNIHHGDFVEVCQRLEVDSVDVIITDPPYPIEFVPVYGKLAGEAARLLKPGGSLFVMCGQSYLPQIVADMSQHLNYHWVLSYQTPGGQSPQIWQRKINTFWKPVLWFTNGDYKGDWHGDVVKSDVNDNDKEHHKWGQSESGMAGLIDKYSEENNVVLDPFLGGGTTGVICIQTGRKFIGIDSDISAINTSKERMFKILQGGENGQ